MVRFFFVFGMRGVFSEKNCNFAKQMNIKDRFVNEKNTFCQSFR